MEARSRRKLRRPRCVLVEETSIVVAFCRTKICPTRNVGDWDADVVEVGRTVLTDTVKRRDCYFELYSLWHCMAANEALREEPA